VNCSLYGLSVSMRTSEREHGSTYAIPQEEISRLCTDLDPFAPVIDQPLDLLWGVVMSIVLVPPFSRLLVLKSFPQLGVEGL
jgi:hypothetical protein